MDYTVYSIKETYLSLLCTQHCIHLSKTFLVFVGGIFLYQIFPEKENYRSKNMFLNCCINSDDIGKFEQGDRVETSFSHYSSHGEEKGG